MKNKKTFRKVEKDKKKPLFPKNPKIDAGIQSSMNKTIPCTQINNYEKKIVVEELINYPSVIEGNETLLEKETFEKADKSIKKVKVQKSKIINLIFLLINIVIVSLILVSQLKGEEGVMTFKKVWEDFLGFGPLMILLGLWFLIMLLESLKFFILIKSSTKKNRLALAYKTAAIGRYYDSVTPMATGGQPFQVFYMKGRGLSASDSISVPIGKYVFSQIAFVVLGLVVAIYFGLSAPSTNGAIETVVSTTSWVGIILNSAIIFVVIFFTINKNIAIKFLTKVFTLLRKMKFIKDEQKYICKIKNIVEEFQITIKHYAKRPVVLISMIVTSFLHLFMHYSIPFVIYAIFVKFDTTVWWQIISLGVMVDMASSFFPMPGGTGVAELSFTTLFAKLFAGASGALFWVLIIWRVMTYYMFIIQGPILMMYDSFFGNRRYAWQAKKWKLQEESKTMSIRKQLSFFDKNDKIF